MSKAKNVQNKNLKHMKIAIILMIAAILLFLAGFVIPLRLIVTVDSEKLYNYKSIEREDVSVRKAPLLTGGKPTEHFSFEMKEQNGYIDVVITSGLLKKSVHVHDISVSSISAVYKDTVYEGDFFNESRIKVTVTFNDGKILGITDYEVMNPPEFLSYADSVVVNTKYGAAQLEIPFADMVELTASPNGDIYEMDEITNDDFKVTMKRSDGTSFPVEQFAVEGPDTLLETSEYKIHTTYGIAKVTIEPVYLSYAKAAKGTAYIGTDYDEEITFVYKDNQQKQVSASDLTFPDGKTVAEGMNKIPFIYHGASHTLYVYGIEKTNVEEAKENGTAEISSAAYKHESDTLFAAVQQHSYGVSMAHVVISNPNQISLASAYDSYGNMETVSSMIKRKKGIIGISGSVFDASTGQVYGTECLIRNGEILSQGMTSGTEICLTNGGALFTPPEGISTASLLSEGVTDMFSTDGALLIQDGHTYAGLDKSTRHPFVAIGMVSPGNYYIASANSPGLTDSEIADYMAQSGCQYARCLGSTTTAFIFDQAILTGSENSTAADCLYISE